MRAELVDVAVLDGVAHRVGHLVELLHAEHRVLAARSEQLDLRVDQADVAPDEPRVAEQEVASLESGERCRPTLGWADQHAGRENSIRLKPPNAAAYWSCQPPLIPRSSRSMAYEMRASSCASSAPVAEHREAGDHAGHERRRAAEAAAGRRFGFDVHLEPAGHADPVDRRLRQVHHPVVLGPGVQVVLDEVARGRGIAPDTWRSSRGSIVTRTRWSIVADSTAPPCSSN